MGRKKKAEKCVCVSCEDTFVAFKCKRCFEKVIMDRCKECHAEIAHGIITPQFIRPQFGGGITVPEDDGGPWQQNAYKDWENNEER
jgi:hypothetical protein